MPLNHDGTFGPNGATGKFGGWFNEEGEPEYVAPTDEEFEAVKVAYEKFWEEEE